jgi:hypothetical protein
MSAFDPKRTSADLSRICPDGHRDDTTGSLCPGLRCAAARHVSAHLEPEPDFEAGAALWTRAERL